MGEGLAQRYTYKDFVRERKIDDHTFTLPKPPKKDEVDGYSLKKKDQRFTPPDKKYVKELSYKIATQQKLSIDDKKFINLQWERRLNGYWFYNNGYLEYITGLHYYYLTAWNIVRVEEALRRDGTMGKRKVSGLPTFTDSDRDYFYIWNSCDVDENCFGLIHITNRRDGKTYRSTATANELISRSPDAIAGIQSKTDTDSAKVFKKLVKSWKALPEYFKPVDVGGAHFSQVNMRKAISDAKAEGFDGVDFQNINGYYNDPDDETVINIVIYGTSFTVIKDAYLMAFLQFQTEQI